MLSIASYFVAAGSTQDEIHSTISFIEEQLIPALNSGRYKQATGTLRRGYGSESSYCCLGLACNIQSRHAWVSQGEPGQLQGWRSCYSDDVVELLNIPQFPMPALSGKALTFLSKKNDWGESFSSIANMLRTEIVPALRAALN